MPAARTSGDTPLPRSRPHEPLLAPHPARAEVLRETLDALRGDATDDGLVCLDARAVARRVRRRTPTVRGHVQQLVEAGLLVPIGAGTLAFAGTPAAAFAASDDGGLDDEPLPRTDPHPSLHDGSGSPRLW